MIRLMELNEELVSAIEQDSDAGSAEAAVEQVLRGHLAQRKEASLRELFGTVEFDPEYDYKAMRANRFPDAE